MGPQLYRCGNGEYWRQALALKVIASMGPQLYRCGNITNSNDFGIRIHTASMGPQLYRCGNPDLELKTVSAIEASMGPQLYRCGNPGIGADTEKTLAKLQWGRNFIVAEILLLASAAPGSLVRFNGAATLSLRKYAGYGQPITQIEASMGPQLYRCGNRSQLHCNDHPPGASMGPQLYRCGNPTQRISIFIQEGIASMGPQLYRCGNIALHLSKTGTVTASMGPQLYRCGNIEST